MKKRRRGKADHLTFGRRHFLSITGAAMAVGSGCSAQTIGDTSENSGHNWAKLPDMPFPVQEIYPTKLETRTETLIVNAGGITPWDKAPFNVTDAVTVYDTVAGSWGFGVKLPEPRHHIALVTVGETLFGVTGFARDEVGGWRMQRNVWQIDNVRDGNWIARSPLPVPQSEPVVLNHDGYIHLIGGRTPKNTSNLEWNDHTDTDRHWVFSPEQNAWQELSALPTARNSAAGVVLGGQIYVISGRTVRGGNTPQVDMFDVTENRWRSTSPLPKATSQKAPLGQGGLAAAVWDGKIYAFGGEWFSSGGGVYADIWEYDPSEEKWRSIGLMPRTRHGLGAVSLSDGIYLLGGASQPSGDGTSATLDRFRPT